MLKILLTSFLLAVFLCPSARAAVAPEARKSPLHGSAQSLPSAASAGMVEVIRSAILANYRGMRIGEAFDRYSHFKNKQWRETRGTGGTFYVDFVGSTPPRLLDFKSRRDGVSASGIEVKFAVYPNGEYGVVMVSKAVTKADGKTDRYPLPDAKTVLDAIYNNRKLDL